MEQLGQGVALVVAGMTLGWTAFFSFVIAPQAYRDLDTGRAGRFVRNAMKNGHPAVATFAFVSAGFAVLGSAMAGASVMGVCGVLYLLALWALAPRDDERPPPGGKRKLSTARIVAAGLTAMIMIAVCVGIVLIALKI
ncbi:MAG: hypothetical protein KJS97_06075 [Alphaproteobacteria bacterium]|nr:hypothetical protein [Alphaproteobacteria bacterium]